MERNTPSRGISFNKLFLLGEMIVNSTVDLNVKHEPLGTPGEIESAYRDILALVRGNFPEGSIHEQLIEECVAISKG